MNQNWIHANMEHYFQLAGKTAIVTGAGNGIGRGIAQKLAGLGANVVACDIEAESVRNTADEITLAGGVCLGLYCDVRKYEDIQKVVDTAVQKFGTVDILVNDAAGCGGGVTVDTINEQEWMRLIELNLNSVFRFTMTVLPIMRAKKQGKIVNISSGAGITGDFSDPHYAAAKGGVIAFTKELAHELAKESINVNSVAPGLVDTSWRGDRRHAVAARRSAGGHCQRCRVFGFVRIGLFHGSGHFAERRCVDAVKQAVSVLRAGAQFQNKQRYSFARYG